MKKFVVFFLIAFFILPLFPYKTPLYADAGPIYLYGVNIVPYNNNSITLQKENLSIEFKKGDKYFETKAHVYAKFVFVNTANSTSVKMGFPFGIANNSITLHPEDVKVKVNGKTIIPDFIRAETSKYDPWIYFDVPFKKGETKTVEISYSAIPLGGYFSYVLDTGALWKGTIGTLDISIKFPYEAVYPNVLNVFPSGYTSSWNEIQYHLTNFEPTSNISIEFLPLSFYEKITPLKEKAEKTNNPEDWFNYALALLPENPFGMYKAIRDGGFVGGYKTSMFKNYVMSVLNRTESLFDRETVQHKILNAIIITHKENLSRFEGGLDVLSVAGEEYTLPDFLLSDFESDAENPHSALEGRMITYLLAYKVFVNFTTDYYHPDFFTSLNKFLAFSEKYFKGEKYPSLPYFVKFEPDKYFYLEGFIPEVKVNGTNIQISYLLPGYIQNALLKNFSFEGKGYTLNTFIENSDPYAFNVVFHFPQSITAEQFIKTKETILNDIYKNAESEIVFNSKTVVFYRFLNIYAKDIFDNLTVKNGEIHFVSPTVSCSEKTNNEINKLNKEKEILKGYKDFEDPNTKTMYIDPLLNTIENNEKGLQEMLSKNCNITFENVSRTNNNKNNALITILYIIIALLGGVVVLLIVRLRKYKPSH